jgi:hypothetical protein
MAGIRIYTRFYDETGMPWAVTVYDTLHVGGYAEVPMGATPIKIRWSGDNLKYIVGSEATLTYVTSVDMSWLRTTTTNQLLVTVWKNPTITNGVWDIFTHYMSADPTKIWWVGFILADTYSRELRVDPTYTINATDRLGTLANYDYCSTADVTPTNRHQKMLTALGNALQTVGLFLPIVSTINLFETTMDMTDADDPMDQLYLDELNFCDEDLELGDSYSVVDKIMRIWKSRIFQAGGYWFVQRLNDFKHPQVKYRVYTFGVYTYPYSYNSVVSHVKAVNKTDFALLFCATEEIAPAYKKIEVTQTYGKLTSMFPGFTFEDQEFNTESPPKPLHWQYSQQLGGVTSNFTRYPIGDNMALVSRSTTSDLTFANRGYLESPRIPMTYDVWDGLLLQIDIGYVWSGDKPESDQQSVGKLKEQFAIKVFFVQDDGVRVWIYKETKKLDPRYKTGEKISWYGQLTGSTEIDSDWSTVLTIPSTEFLENLQKIELYIQPIPTTATQGKLYIQIKDPNTNYGTWPSAGGVDKHFYIHLCIDNIILLHAPRPDASPLGPVGVWRYYDTDSTITVINSDNRVNASYPLDLGEPPAFLTDAVNKFQAYSGLLNLSSTVYLPVEHWQEIYLTSGIVATSALVAGGRGYHEDEVLIISPSSGTNFVAHVETVSGSGAVLTYSVSSTGSGHTVGTKATTTNRDGSGCTINILTLTTNSVTTNSKHLTDWIIDGYAENETPSMIVRGAIRGAADYFNTVQFPYFVAVKDPTILPTTTFLPQDMEFDIKAITWSGSWIEMKGMMIPLEYTSEVEPRKSLQK